ncbi:MAG TPA: efflux transporter outer membrane subunit [Caulobacteraceae bacterium]|nr:efflux transporter outer membrane subunit [Caulobacteraceae bacterium]
MPKHPTRLLPMLLATAALCACEVGPNYQRPAAPTPQAFKEVQGWTPANPQADAATRADWWTIFDDPVLNGLEEKVATNNFSLAADLAAYEQARALVGEQRAALFPTVNGTATAQVSQQAANGGSLSAGGTVIPGGRGVVQNYSLQLGGTWEPDLWGRVRRSIENARGTAQATYADLINAKLSAQLELAADYISLRALDEQKRFDDDTVKAYAESLKVTQNKYDAGVAALSDVDTAATLLHNVRAADTALGQQRAQMEHAIAVLIGVPPSEFSIAPGPWNLKPLDVPPGVPSTLLERRPDVAGAERRAAAASAEIGVATAGYFPNVTLTGTGGTEALKIASLFSPQSFFWNLGLNAAQTLFNGGLTHAQVQAARSGYDQAVATYRQTVLTAFQQVEDNLAAQRVLAAEQPDLQASVTHSDQAARILTNQYNAGTIDYTAVVVAEIAAYNAHNAELQLEASRLTTTVDLIVALGGGWNEAQLGDKGHPNTPIFP